MTTFNDIMTFVDFVKGYIDLWLVCCSKQWGHGVCLLHGRSFESLVFLCEYDENDQCDQRHDTANVHDDEYDCDDYNPSTLTQRLQPQDVDSQMHLFTFVKPSGVTGSFPSANGCKRDILLNLMISSFF